MLNIGTLIAVIIFASIFILGDKIHIPGKKEKHYNRFLSFAAGISIGYIFLHLLPQLNKASELFFNTSEHLPFPDLRVYFFSMLGLVFFYTLSFAIKKSKKTEMGYRISILSFSAYLFVISYMLLHFLEVLSLWPYAIVMFLHLFIIEYHLRKNYETSFLTSGKFVIAIFGLVGYVFGLIYEIPLGVLISMAGFISGGIIFNSIFNELPREGKTLYFLLGILIYIILILMI